MLVDFNRIEEISISKMNGGTGELSAKLYRDAYGKVILCRIHASSSIGLHSHETSDGLMPTMIASLYVPSSRIARP